MISALIDYLVAGLWNRFAGQRRPAVHLGLFIASAVTEAQQPRRRIVLPNDVRTQHTVILGKTGFGKSYLIRQLLLQDVRAGQGGLVIDEHGDLVPFMLAALAREERRKNQDLSSRIIIINPADPLYSVGCNPIASRPEDRHRHIADVAALLDRRFEQNRLGVRTEELLRNLCYLLADAGLTLVDASPLLTNPTFLTATLRTTQNEAVRSYFVERYSKATEQMQATIREPILSRLSAFVGDPKFRDVLGQPQSTFSLKDALDNDCWILCDLNKGLLGPDAVTFSGLILTLLKTALFARSSRTTFSVYCDEVQNLVPHAGDLETLFSESRKFGVALTTANQFMQQHPPDFRAALLSAATFILFRLSTGDAEQFSAALDGGRRLAELLRNLPKRHVVVKTADEAWEHGLVPELPDFASEWADLYNRSMLRWARKRVDVSRAISLRHEQALANPDEALHDWK